VLLHGEIDRAHREANLASQYYSSKHNREWYWKFRVLDASALSLGEMSREVLSLLSGDLPESLSNSELAHQKLVLQGLAYARLHKFNEAEQNLQQARALCLQTNSSVTGDALKALGLLQIEKGEYERAKQFFEESLNFARQRGDGSLESWALLDLGYVTLQQEHFDEAIEWLGAATKKAESIGANLVAEKSLGDLGWAYYKTGESERSLELYEEAAKRAVELGSLGDQVAWLTTAGYVYLDANKFSTAEDHYRRALELARKTHTQEDIFNALLSLAFVTVQTNELDQAAKYADEAIAMARADNNRIDELYPLLASGQIAVRRNDPVQAEKIFVEVANDEKVDPSLKWGAQHELANLYVDQHEFARADSTFRTTLNTFEAARHSIQHEDVKLPFLSNASSLYDDYVRFLVKQGKIVEALQTANASRAQTLLEGLGMLRGPGRFAPAAFQPRQVAQAEGGVILFYWLGPIQSYLWAVTPAQTKLFELPPEAEIDARVQSYRKALIESRDVLQQENADGIKLYETLVAPAAKLIASNSRAVIVADGSLNNLNFETLLVPGPKPHFWIEDVTVVSASSLRPWAVSRSSPRTAPKLLLLLGDPVSPNSKYAELPKAAQEIHDIQKHFPAEEQRVFARDQATATAYLTSRLEQYAYIHFVAHGTASRLSPLDSAIVLSKASAQEDSFKLYARDIIRYPLRANLVTISTCYGSGSRAYAGEGLVGLSWAFLRAGAHNVIGALWEVSDASTPQLMDKLYAELKQGRAPDVALRSAKLSLLRSDGVFRKPFYWAPFQLYVGS